MQKFKEAVETLQFAQGEIKKIFTSPEDEGHMLKVTTALQTNINYLSLLGGVDDKTPEPQKLRPAKTIGGDPIVLTGKVKKEDVEPDKEKVKVLKQHVAEAYDKFLTTETDIILKEFDEIVIRGVAKKAGFNKVTKENPETITPEFIVEIKEAIKAKK